MAVSNSGNIRIRPTVSIDVWDIGKENLVLSREIILDEVLPTTEKAMFRAITHNLDTGQYWANIAIDECGASTITTFSVFEKGGVADRGELRYITNKAWAFVGETVSITALFQNIGERVAYAKFQGDIRLDDKVVKVIETEEAEVPKGETRNFDIYFSPEKEGRYVITGKVAYNKKVTFERSSILNVNPSEVADEEESSGDRMGALLIYLILIVTILFIIRKIIKEKKKRWF